jgi:PAS domain S-box-containing protein
LKLALSNSGNGDGSSDLLSNHASNQRAKTVLLFAGGALLYWALVTLTSYFSGLDVMKLSPFFVGAAGYFLGFRAGMLASAAALVVHTVVFNGLGFDGPLSAFQVNPAVHAGILLLGPMAGRLRSVLRRLQIESQIRQAAAGSHEALWIVTADRSRVLYVNPAFDDVFGIPTDYILENPAVMQDVVHPDDRPGVDESFVSVPEEGRRFEYRIVRFDGAVRWIETTISRVRDNKGGMRRIVGVSRDVTRRKCSATEQSGRDLVLEKLAAGASLIDALTALATSIEQLVPDSICSITLVDAETGRLYSGAFPGLPDGFVELSDGLEPATTDSCAGRAIMTGGRFVTGDLKKSPFEERYVEQAAAAGIHACWSEPIRSPQGGILGALTLYLKKPAAPTEREGAVLASAANIAAIAIEHKQSEVALKETGERLHAFVRHNPAAIAMLDTEMRYVVVSDQWCTLHKLANEDIIGRSHYQIVPGTPDRWKRIYARCLGGGVETSDGETVAGPDGCAVSLKWDVRPWRRNDGEIGGIMIFNEVLNAAPGAPAPEELPVDSPPASSRGFRTVMVAEDQQTVLEMVCEVLREGGCRVLRAGDGEAALEIAEAGDEDVDLLITELIMPGVNGRDIAAEIRKTNPRLKVLYLSGYIGKASVRIAELGPGTSFLSRPFTPEALVRKVRLLLDPLPAESVPSREVLPALDHQVL